MLFTVLSSFWYLQGWRYQILSGQQFQYTTTIMMVAYFSNTKTGISHVAPYLLLPILSALSKRTWLFLYCSDRQQKTAVRFTLYLSSLKGPTDLFL